MDEMYFYQPRRPVLDHHEILPCRVEANSNGKKVNSKLNIIACGVAIVLAIFLAGLGLGFWSCNLKKAMDKSGEKDESKEKKTTFRHENIAALIDRRQIEKHLRFVALWLEY